MARKEQKGRFWNFVDNLEGDKVVWMIVLLLILISIVCIFSSTSLLALTQKTSRISIVTEQLVVSVIGLGLIILCYNIKSLKFFRACSQLGYAVSMLMLIFLALHVDLGVVKAAKINDAWRAISIKGAQLHVFEVVKVAMVMYLAWAVDTYNNNGFRMTARLARHPRFEFLDKPIWQKIVYIYIPIFTVCVAMMVGSLSSTVFIGAIMFITILIGGISIRELILPGLAAVGVLAGCILINTAVINRSGPESAPFPHLEHALGRLHSDTVKDNLEIMENNPVSSKEFRDARDKILQPVSAKIAIHEGGLIGKGPGRSTQRYKVPVMYEDYMFSFIIEEYGLLGAIIVIILYLSLLARGSLIVRNCDDLFAKTAVAGLVVLITGQAFMHMFINADLGPLTGQTLPMISHGNSSFLMFSLAFGIILSISRIAHIKIEKEVERLDPLSITTAGEPDSVKSGLDELEELESSEILD